MLSVALRGSGPREGGARGVPAGGRVRQLRKAPTNGLAGTGYTARGWLAARAFALARPGAPHDQQRRATPPDVD
jgi:hypothetical protein